MSAPIISVTGSKGKTTIARAIEHIIAPEVEKILRVDTEGAWLNGRQKFSHQDSKRIWGLAPGNSPGRFLSLLAGPADNQAAILEVNLFSSGPAGLGYNAHKVGIFSNVYSEHQGALKRLKGPSDIATAKSFIFSRLDKNGYAVFNADNKYVVSQLSKIPKDKAITRVACSTKSADKALDAEIKIYIKDGEIIYSAKGKEKSLGQLEAYRMHIPGFPATAMNLMLIVGALLGYYGGKLSPTVISRTQQYQPESGDGRLAIFESKKSAKIIFDFAHEQKSLRAVSELARSLSPAGKIIGVLRLSPTKSQSSIERIARHISACYDYFIIYDKIDGITRRPDGSLSPFLQEKTGYISRIFSEALKKNGAAKVERIIDENKALERAIGLADEDDVIVFIQGNSVTTSFANLKRSLNQLKRIA
jgi:cyanophycin synthetase